METDVDSDGEDKEMIRKSLIEELLSILHEYPDDGQILKELIQNAEDAGATVVKVLTDTRSFHRDTNDKALQGHRHLKYFQGPALCVYNDAQFTEEDWDGIRRLGTSIKAKDPLKVGRFGLGFKSVFHMTDRLVVLSGKKMMYMDPFKPESQFCNEQSLTGKKGRLLESLVHCLDGVFGVSKETFQQEGPGLPGTIFWFPLRLTGSELSSTVYDQDKVDQLMSSFKTEARSLLLFLTNVQQVTISTRDDQRGIQQLFSVGLAASCRDEVTEKRRRFKAAIKKAGQDLPPEGCYCLADVVMETVDFASNRDAPAQRRARKKTKQKKDPESHSESWLVASYHPGQGDISEELAQLCSDPNLSYRPHVGVAAPRTKRQDFQSQVFCFLPLPLDTRSPTGLPVHVHGYFALDQSRRHLKWPTGDQLDSAAVRTEPSLRWNCLLVRELLPHVYHTLLDRLKATSLSRPLDYYATWPDAAKVEDRWRCVLRPLYTSLIGQPSFLSQGGQWVTLQQEAEDEEENKDTDRQERERERDDELKRRRQKEKEPTRERDRERARERERDMDREKTRSRSRSSSRSRHRKSPPQVEREREEPLASDKTGAHAEEESSQSSSGDEKPPPLKVKLPTAAPSGPSPSGVKRKSMAVGGVSSQDVVELGAGKKPKLIPRKCVEGGVDDKRSSTAQEKAVLKELSPDVCKRLGHRQGGAREREEQGEAEEEGDQLREAVSRLYNDSGRELVPRLPRHVHDTLRGLDLLVSVEVMTPRCAARLLQSHDGPRLSRCDRLHLLRFLTCQDDRLELLRNQNLLPLADGTFAAFKARGQQNQTQNKLIRWSQDSLQQLFPGLEDEFCDNSVPAALKDCLRSLARSGKFLLEELDKDHVDIPGLIERSLQLRPGDQQPSVTHDWAKQIWNFLVDKELTNFNHLKLLPLIRKDDVALLPLSGIYLCSSVRDSAPLKPSLRSSLSKLEVRVLPDLPEYVIRHKGVLDKLVHYPTTAGVIKTLNLVNDNDDIRELAIDKFNTSVTVEESTALTAFLRKQRYPDMFRCLKLFTEVGKHDAVSVSEVSWIAPESLPRLKSQHRMLRCTTVHERRLASQLGAKEITLLKIVTDIVKQILNKSVQCSNPEILTFTKFVLCQEELTNSEILRDLLVKVRFLPTPSGCLKIPHELYDPSSSTLKKLFANEEKFPSDDYLNTDILRILKRLGLRGENSIVSSDIVHASDLIENFLKQKKYKVAVEKANGLFEILCSNGKQFNSYTLKQISSRKCLPCLRDSEKPDTYPTSLAYSSNAKLAKPKKMCLSSHAQLVGSVCPIMRGSLPVEIMCKLEMIDKDHLLTKKEGESPVLNHLDNVLSHFRKDEVNQYRFILGNIFSFLGQHANNTQVVKSLVERKCVLVEAGDEFAKPGAFWINGAESDIQLKPYRYPLPANFMKNADLFEACGASKHQDAKLLKDVLLEMEAYHMDQAPAERDCKRDMDMVIRILGVLCKMESADEGSVLLPVHHSQGNILLFKPAKECTVLLSHKLPPCDEDDEIVYVHNDIQQGTAIALGAMQIRERALIDVEHLDFGYGQHEELTDRLHKLLEDSYTDGFSVPKELIQNADDAGATEICFLLDERENEDARTNLITDNMESLQGPAFWAYNDATFSDKDFENITKFGACTKKNDASKVGRFGLGFNAVYNLTDVPSFISRHTMAMFDPHQKHLVKQPGLKLDFRRKVNKALLSRMPEQFKPFQDVFGCKLLSNVGVDYEYDGTLFRFPLRTKDQAKESKIKDESYGEKKRGQFLQMLLENAGSLLMFTQSVQIVKVFYLPRDSKNPSAPHCLLTVTKTSSNRLLKPESPLGGKTVLQYCTSQWPNHSDIQIVQDIKIKVTVTPEAESVCQVQPHDSTSQWRLAWASGVDQSLSLVRFDQSLSLAAVACLIEAGRLKPVSESPRGFYKSGHYFCFLPLPDNTVSDKPHVHINATFALTSSRRGLLTSTGDDLGGEREGADWNSALIADAVSRAYLLLLENVQTEAASDPDFKRFFDLWPVSGEEVLSSVLRRLITDGNKVFPVLGEGVRWVAFPDAWFLELQFRQQACGNIAWKAMQHFWKMEGHLVDLPTELSSALSQSDQRERFQERVISEIDFFKDSFFPNVDNCYWQQRHRDELVLHALVRNKPELKQLLQTSRCIPCTQLNTLKRPDELIHPKGDASKLFSPTDGRFPQAASPSSVDFCTDGSLMYLLELDMIENDLPFEMLIERATSVQNLLHACKESATLRAKQLIVYLSSDKITPTRINQMQSDAIEELSKVRFLPVLSQPTNWLLPWAAEAPGTLQLAAPCELYSNSEDLKHLVGCHKLLVDNEALGISNTHITLVQLGVQVKQDLSSTDMFETAVRQLRTVAKTTNEREDISPMSMLKLCTSVYSYLSKCYDQEDHTRKDVIDKREQVVWTNTGFVDSSRVAMELGFNCQPYLFKLETTMLQYSIFFEEIGVKKTFDVDNLASLLKSVRDEHVDTQLSHETVGLVSRVAQQLCHCLGPSPLSEETEIFLPDRHGDMRPTSNLCLDDCEWLKETETMKFISGEVPNETASKLGVKSKRRQDLESLCEFIPFGQSEKLTDRISRLLQGYTFDSSLFKELLQNADDAGATEIKFIKDWRQLGRKQIFEGCEPLQGPALCVFNDKSFTRKDMEGIQNLGRGSKGLDVLKTGQYGVGFNAVYHVTDAPSFWTLQDGVQETICFLDPNCQYVPNSAPHTPGIKLTDINRIREAYPDMFDGYLGSAVDMTQPGTLFRLPLRTKEMAQRSGIKKSEVTERMIDSLLDTFQKEMSSCLLFLNNVKKIGIYSVTKEGTLELENEIRIDLSQSSLDKPEAFKQHLLRASATLGDEATNMNDIDSFESCLLKTIQETNGHEEQWLIVQRIGFKNADSISHELQTEWHKEHFQLLPRGGVAVRLPQRSTETGLASSAQLSHQAFCTLPLPIFTNLPVHVNGHFALDHETRRNLWDNAVDGRLDTRTEWNELIASQVIVPAYTYALQHVKERLFSSTEKKDATQLSSKLRYYNSLFPDPDQAPSQFWTSMVQKLYHQIAEAQLPIFPVVLSAEDCLLEWHPVFNSCGFGGHFNNLEAFFGDVPDEDKPIPCKTQQQQRVPLSQGGVQQHGNTQDVRKWAKEKAKTLKTLLIEINMKVLEVPYCIFDNFQKSGVKTVVAVTPTNVAKFLKSAGSLIPGACNVGDLPQPVSDTSIKTSANVKTLLHFIQYERALLKDLEGLPLCLRQSEALYSFHNVDDKCKPIATPFSDLLTGSAELFVHQIIQGYFLPILYDILTWIKEFDISTLVRLLPLTIPESDFKSGVTCSFTDNLSPTWLNLLWLFVDSKVGNSLSTFEHQLRGLLEWSLIPVTVSVWQSTGVHQTLEKLYPVKRMREVIFLSHKPDPSNRAVWHTLRALHLPFLNSSHLKSVTIVKRMVASISEPPALLEALYSCAGSLKLTNDEARSIMDYFNRSQVDLSDSLGHNTRMMLRSLPVFPGIDGEPKAVSSNTEVLCLEDDVPLVGLEEWSAKRQQKLLLLKKTSLPEDLRDFLDLDAPGTATFYHLYLLRTLQCLPLATIVDHMKVIKQGLKYSFPQWGDNDKALITRLLRIVEFIKLDDKLVRADIFFSPHHPVFSKMCLPDKFPPAPYNKQDWEHFMTSAGMISEVTSEMFVRFAKLLQDEGKSHVSELTARKSDTLVKHLFNRRVSDDKTDKYDYQQIRDIRFVRPSEWAQTVEGISLCRIAPPCCRNRLLSFSESCGEEHLPLVWTSCCILHRDANAKTKADNKNTRRVSTELGLTEKAPLNKVMQHAKSVCQSLGKGIEKELLDSVKKVMGALYRHLQEHATDEDNATLKQLTFIFDDENEKMLKPENVVIGLREEEAIKGHIVKAPEKLGEFYEFFKRLGASQVVTADHYATVLSRLKQEATDKALHVEELKVTQIAIRELFRCLKSSKQQISELTTENLYLPSESEILIKSSLLVFDDTVGLGKRIPKEAKDVVFFLGFKKLEIKIMSPKKELELLPSGHQLQFLSEMVTEAIPEEVKRRRGEGRHSLDVVRKFSDPGFVDVVVRQAFNHSLRDNSSEFSEDTAIDISKRLSTIACFEVTDLKTIILWKEQPIDGTASPKWAFYDKVSDGDGPCSIYLDFAHCDSKGIDSSYVIRICAAAVVNTIDLPGGKSIIEQALNSPARAMDCMDDEGLDKCDFNAGADDETVFPPAGTLIPLHLHCCLDNNFGSFDKGEHVGYEVYDPQVDESSTDKSEPVYMYGIVVEEVDQEAVTRFTRRYRVDLGKEKGIAEASVTQLYKFIRTADQGPATPAQGPLDDDGNAISQVGEGASTEAAPTPTLNFKEVMEEIKEMLEEAWRDNDEKILRRVMKRLYLKWHPDKNIDNQTFCTRVVQRLQNYVNLLKQGKKIPDEDDSGGSSDHQRSSSKGSRYSSFFENMFRRGRDYDKHFRDQSRRNRRWRSRFRGRRSHGHEEDYREHHYSSYKDEANPQPGEARRWFRQAQADLTSARATRAIYEKGLNWVCYQCYQAIETSLKAVLYNRDANKTPLHEHSVEKLAAAVDVAQLVDLASRFHREVGSSQRMCYPDPCDGSNIPADVYSAAHVDVALHVATETIDEVKTILGFP